MIQIFQLSLQLEEQHLRRSVTARWCDFQVRQRNDFFSAARTSAWLFSPYLADQHRQQLRASSSELHLKHETNLVKQLNVQLVAGSESGLPKELQYLHVRQHLLTGRPPGKKMRLALQLQDRATFSGATWNPSNLCTMSYSA